MRGCFLTETEASTKKYLELASFAEEFVNSRYEKFLAEDTKAQFDLRSGPFFRR